MSAVQIKPYRHRIFLVFCMSILLSFSSIGSVLALGSTDPQQTGTTGLQGKVSSPPPKTAATISTPTSGSTFRTTPITVSGLCTTGLLVKIFSNNIFIGSAQCVNGNYSVQVDLFGGDNELVARVFDALDQSGPDSNIVKVSFTNAEGVQIFDRVTLTSTIAQLGAPVGSELTWPIVISGGTGPYAISVDWGDGTAADLKSVPFAGSFTLNHTYKSAGYYRVVIKATDSKGSTAFLQLVGVGSGDASQSSTGSKSAAGTGAGGTTRNVYVWWPVLTMVPIILAAFWVGKKYELSALHRQLEKQAQMYDSEIQR